MGAFRGLNANGMSDKGHNHGATDASLSNLPSDARVSVSDMPSEARPELRKRKRTESDSEETGEGITCKEMVTSAGSQVCKSPVKKIKTGRVEKKNTQKNMKAKTVIFVPQTANSQLAKMLREEEATLEKMTGYRVKYVERAGSSIGNLLCRSDHWAGRLCGRKECLLCYTK